MMGALFSAFDRPVYQRLVPQHLYDLLFLPFPILAHLRALLSVSHPLNGMPLP